MIDGWYLGSFLIPKCLTERAQEIWVELSARVVVRWRLRLRNLLALLDFDFYKPVISYHSV